jgi:hypothetical protein
MHTVLQPPKAALPEWWKEDFGWVPLRRQFHTASWAIPGVEMFILRPYFCGSASEARVV